jgi:hypothetical protein
VVNKIIMWHKIEIIKILKISVKNSLMIKKNYNIETAQGRILIETSLLILGMWYWLEFVI